MQSTEERARRALHAEPLKAITKCSSSKRAAVIAALSAQEREYLASLTTSLQQFAEEYCGISDLSPLMKAIMDAADGIPVTSISDEECQTHFGCKRAWLPKTPARTIAVRAGGRAGKTSRIVAAAALHAAWTVPVPLLASGESAYVVLVAPTIKLARQALSFIRGYVDTSETLSAAKVHEDADHVGLRRPDGNVARIEVFAAGRGGAQLRAKTLVGALFDESAFFRDESTGVVCDSELYRAVLPRLVPTARCWLVSTPWVASLGLLEEMISKNFGSHANALAVTAPTKSLNPAWDPDGTITADLIANDSDAYEREILAIPLTAGSQQFFSYEAIKQAVKENRPQQLEYNANAQYFFGGDCGFRRNSSALVVVERVGERYRIAFIDELRPTPGMPLSPAGVVNTFAGVMREYHGAALVADSHERDAVALEFARHRMSVVNAPDKVEGYVAARKLFHEGKVELPKNDRIVRQLRDVIAKPQPGGGLSISSPRKADGSHGDLVSALVLALWIASVPQPRPRTTVGIGKISGFTPFA